ncbi:MAG TPA: DUF1003 domain-containing protein [Pyrinomonadaceae bacterium]
MGETIHGNGAGDTPTRDADAASASAGAAESIRCPACGGANAPEAVFCANAECGKALGPFAYVREELEQRTRWHERLADRVTAFIGRPQFILAHTLWFAAWLAVNTGIVAFVARFDDYPYSLLGLIISVEAIFITGFLLISQNRQNAHADKRAELDYEVNVRTYREISELKALLRELHERLDTMEGGGARGQSSERSGS